jgi:hypothetical protein
MKRLLRSYLIAIGLYLLVVGGGVVITLTLSSAVGYLPYSDRPGPGWHEPSLSVSQMAYYFSWATLLALPSLMWGTAVFGFVLLLRFLGGPNILIRVLGGLCAATVSLVVVADAGWYIAIAAFPIWVSAALGAVWGAALLPRYTGPNPSSRPGSVRWALIALCTFAVPGALYWAFFVPGYSQQLAVQIVRVTPSQNALLPDSWKHSFERGEIELLTSLFPNGDLHGGISGSSGSGREGVEARMLVVVTGPLEVEARLKVPKGVSVVYVQRGQKWTMYPSTAPTLRKSIALGPGTHPGEATFAWPDGPKPSSFTWYPPIQ